MPTAPDHLPEATIADSPGGVVRYRDRQSGQLVTEHAPGTGIVRWLYSTLMGRQCLRLLAHYPLASNLCGWWQKQSFTRRDIRTFVQRYGVDMSEAQHPAGTYRNFNDFFTRQLKREARPFVGQAEALCSPADGKALVYPHLGADALLPIKGQQVSIGALLASDGAAARFAQGSALVVRLAPYDYHRFHFFDAGSARSADLMSGQYHSVNPMALERKPTIFALNKRAITAIDSANFGEVCCIEVGALNVSSIVQTYAPGSVERGQEKGYFQFGGSTLVLLFTANSVVFDGDLLEDSAAGIEVHVRAGERLGQCA